MNSEYGVVMRNEAPSVSNALKARSSVADSYQYILDQLEIAIEKLLIGKSFHKLLKKQPRH